MIKYLATHEDLQLLNKIALVEYIQEENIKETSNQSYKQKVEKIEIKPELDNTEITGKSFSEALILTSTNPQYDKRLFLCRYEWKQSTKRLFIELQVQYM